MKTIQNLLIATILSISLSGCTALNLFAERSHVSIVTDVEKTVIGNKLHAEFNLHGSNRAILAAYKDALSFTLDKIK